MTFFNCLLQLLILFIGTVYLMPLHETIDQQTHTFRWALKSDLNDTICATVQVPPRYANTTTEIQFWNNTDMKCSPFVSYHLYRPNVSQPICESNSSLFVLIGNPGVIWHPESNQCLHIALHTLPAGHGDYIGSVFDRTYKTLSTSYECEHDNSNLALFKYDKNKPQRLSFLGDIDMKTGKREERCIRNFFGDTIQVEPTCTDDGVPTKWIHETQFHEVV